MKIPKTIKIGGFIWQIKQDEAIANDGDTFGSCQYRKQILNITPNETQQKREQCLIHEILHAIIWQTGHKFEKYNDEDALVQALSMGIHQILKDNKLLK